VFSDATAILLASSSAGSYTYESLTASTAYYLWIKANYSGGSSVVVILGPVTTSEPPPPPPTDFESTGVTATTITVEWSAPTASGVQGYIVYRNTDDNIAGAEEDSTSFTSYTHDNLSANTTYFLWVKADYGSTQSELIRISVTTEAQ
jgi:hypothetical protein